MRGLTSALVCLLLLLATACENDSTSEAESASSAPDSASSALDSATASTTGSTPDTTSSGRPSSGCGVAPDRLGRSNHTVTVDGLERTYLQYIPRTYDGVGGTPLVIDMHGLTSNAEAEAALTGFESLSEEEGFVVVMPNGTGLVPYWNIVSGGRADGDPTIEELVARVVDDVSFVDQLVDHVASETCIDLDRVYAVGMSNGALMASVVGCDLADTFAAVASVAGTLSPVGCAPGAPILSIHGTRDEVVHYDGGLGETVRNLIDTQQFTEGTPLADQVAIITVIDEILPPLDEALEQWAEVNGCESDPAVERLGDDVEHRTWSGCTADVEQYVVEGGGHTWPGSALLAAATESGNEAATALGAMTENLDATPTIWEFFDSHSLQP